MRAGSSPESASPATSIDRQRTHKPPLMGSSRHLYEIACFPSETRSQSVPPAADSQYQPEGATDKASFDCSATSGVPSSVIDVGAATPMSSNTAPETNTLPPE